MKGGIGWKLITFALDRDPWKFYLMFLSREIDLQLCQIYTKINIFCIKVVGLKRSNSANMQPIWKLWYHDQELKWLAFSLYPR